MENFTIVNKTLTFLAKRNSGKSVLCKYLVKAELEKFDKIFLICPTEKINSHYEDIVEPDNVFDEYSEEWVETLIKKMTEINANKKDKKNVMLILDDCVADINFHQSPSLKKLYTRGRHINISICLILQYMNMCPPVCRVNSDFLFVGQLNKQSIHLLSEEFQSGDINKEEFIKMYNKSTNDYHFLVINNNSVKDNDINSIYGKIKVPIENV